MSLVDLPSELLQEAAVALQALISDAEQRQDHQIEQSALQALKVLPRPLRPIAKKVLLG